MRLSAAMIVKDEEAMLPGCIESIKDVVDEICVVDTGSTDMTVRIALDAGCRVMFQPWQNDFSLHRNQSIEMCSGDWILIIDADERLAGGKKSLPELKEAFSKIPKQTEVLAATVQNMNRDGAKGSRFISPRWIRPHLRYANAKHNELQFSSQAAGTDFVIEHYGYDKTVVADKDKFNRDLQMLRADFKGAACIDDEMERAKAMARLHHYMSNLFMMGKRYRGGIAHGMAALKVLGWIKKRGDIDNGTMQLFSKLYHTIAMAHYNLRELQKAYAWAQHGADMYQKHPDFHADLVFIGRAAGNDKLIDEHGPQYFECVKAVNDNPFSLGCSMVFMAGEDSQELVRSAMQ